MKVTTGWCVPCAAVPVDTEQKVRLKHVMCSLLPVHEGPDCADVFLSGQQREYFNLS